MEGKARIILTALVTPASIMDNTPMLDLVKYVCSRWKLQPKQATGYNHSPGNGHVFIDGVRCMTRRGTQWRLHESRKVVIRAGSIDTFR